MWFDLLQSRFFEPKWFRIGGPRPHSAGFLSQNGVQSGSRVCAFAPPKKESHVVRRKELSEAEIDSSPMK
jgi:hypothetical protein